MESNHNFVSFLGCQFQHVQHEVDGLFLETFFIVKNVFIPLGIEGGSVILLPSDLLAQKSSQPRLKFDD